jgi:drug/metabolite transporter (DMT)-like permease
VVFGAFIIRGKNENRQKPNAKFYFTILIGVVCQTILADYLWFYCSFKIGIDIFQIILATLPLWLYAVDVYVLKKSKPNVLFLLVAIVASVGILLVMV